MENTLNDKIKQAKNGDSEALAALLADYKPMIDSAVSSFLPSFKNSGYTQDDLLQEAAIAAVKAVQTFDPERGVTFGAYAKTCVRNRIISVYRKQTRHVGTRGNALRDQSAESTPNVISEIPDGFADCLTEYEREVYSLYMRAYKPREISEILNKDIKSVYNAMCRIRQKAKNIK